ncbi:uncharacterized protein LOC113898289 [Bos indicus x Bos taurus]|uniref:uncharacterized protein LOC113898289 n=1 Tax=Bos indicus x Bos taurus TaxID=30522 RepID=UPI000F7D1BEF|nr:uncharacterized protein LOC113898289 [Bos indicus x Bos taurus]
MAPQQDCRPAASRRAGPATRIGPRRAKAAGRGRPRQLHRDTGAGTSASSSSAAAAAATAPRAPDSPAGPAWSARARWEERPGERACAAGCQPGGRLAPPSNTRRSLPLAARTRRSRPGRPLTEPRESHSREALRGRLGSRTGPIAGSAERAVTSVLGSRARGLSQPMCSGPLDSGGRQCAAIPQAPRRASSRHWCGVREDGGAQLRWRTLRLPGALGLLLRNASTCFPPSTGLTHEAFHNSQEPAGHPGPLWTSFIDPL